MRSVRRSDQHSVELIQQLKRTNNALSKQLAQAQAQWKELQRQNKEVFGQDRGTPPEDRIPAKMQHLLDSEYDKMKTEYLALRKNIDQLRKKFDASQETKMKKQLKAQEELLERLKKDSKESAMLQRERTKALQSAEELPHALYKLQVCRKRMGQDADVAEVGWYSSVARKVGVGVDWHRKRVAPTGILIVRPRPRRQPATSGSPAGTQVRGIGEGLGSMMGGGACFY